MKKSDIITIILIVLTLLLVALKFTTCPGLTWGWILAPLWIPCAIGVIALLAVIVVLSYLNHNW